MFKEMFAAATLLGILAVSSFTQAHTINDCSSEVDQGTTCSTSKPVVRYYYDTTIETCLPFLYKGCGGNKNNYKSPRNCTLLCTKMDKYGCNGGKNITGQCNKNGLSCPEGSICKYGAFNFGYYCDTTIETCLPFLYKGCGGNKNNYKSPRNCTLLCTKMDKYGCNGGKNITGQCNKNGLSCPEGSICKYGAFNFGVCCDSETEGAAALEVSHSSGKSGTQLAVKAKY
ncbi:Kunitz/Bovine pancreatic trypsin inhibitor domain protein [Oesophagostomum dentatum]|uniref:Kunitz/Bovine pancreatic trypsin inhibitor domain protein n=1 Tax=Oesophagostomum dentatum TaxID=61180 RepID=A0A0B1T060_OESDE|nr:Kunitz/Bovine pancreatic trypsin inhibitor domain protein [Oesophagostomum dentatum]